MTLQDRMEERRDQLLGERARATQMLSDVDRRRSDLAARIFSIDGAVQVLSEMLTEPGPAEPAPAEPAPAVPAPGAPIAAAPAPAGP